MYFEKYSKIIIIGIFQIRQIPNSVVLTSLFPVFLCFIVYREAVNVTEKPGFILCEQYMYL